ncbi:MAG TPA: cation diffusion facilitator family transporter [Noviherbaspirillum sp.]|uniref:cation diffusion facilitator family transporter n=1 Tax=Noviherbaspirillum sp. TaxID=1926288 RepID=UPI002DDC99CF|nr:cation diffusion facilitator family transporter [Noviherbaspirillum sp.]HEV2608760.1 cation diffusion facilitator family transporter [Noviherbaspirillum sp.]
MKSRPASSTHLHAHHAGDASHGHSVEGRDPRVLGWSLMLTMGFALVEVTAGFWANSLALISDAGHMATDSIALGLALLAQIIAKRPPSATKSFGFGRAEALAAFINGLAMLAVVAWISIEAAKRFLNPSNVQGEAVLMVASIGLAINLVVAWLLSHDKESVNTKAALIHVMGDLLGSLAALIAGAVIYFTGWMPIDPLLSILVCLLILRSTFHVLRQSYHFLMEGVPAHIDYLQVGADLAAINGVLSVHDLHVWEMTPGQPALIGHVEIRELQEWPAVLHDIKTMLLEKHGIDHITVQAEISATEKRQ